jgi:hypothetical protein
MKYYEGYDNLKWVSVLVYTNVIHVYDLRLQKSTTT